MVGAFAVGPLADRHGRKTMLIVSMVLFGGASLAASLSNGLASLTWLRLLTGIGLGGAMPMTITISSEYVPGARRSSLLTLMFCGFTIGSAMGGIIAAQILPYYGWRALLVVGGTVPLLLAPMLAAVLPESVRYLVMKGCSQDRIARIVHRIAPSADLRCVKFVDAAASKASPVQQLFRGGLFLGTLLLWLAFFMSLLVVYLLTNWMPTLIQQASGASLADAARMAALFQLGGTLGAILVGRLMDKFEPHGVLCSIYLVGSVCVILISLSAKTPSFMNVLRVRRRFVCFGRASGCERIICWVLSDALPCHRR